MSPKRGVAGPLRGSPEYARMVGAPSSIFAFPSCQLRVDLHNLKLFKLNPWFLQARQRISQTMSAIPFGDRSSVGRVTPFSLHRSPDLKCGLKLNPEMLFYYELVMHFCRSFLQTVHSRRSSAYPAFVFLPATLKHVHARDTTSQQLLLREGSHIGLPKRPSSSSSPSSRNCLSVGTQGEAKHS